jgi:hypothetical protein
MGRLISQSTKCKGGQMELDGEETKIFVDEINRLFKLRNEEFKAIHLTHNLIVIEQGACEEFFEVFLLQDEIVLSTYIMPPAQGEN